MARCSRADVQRFSICGPKTVIGAVKLKSYPWTVEFGGKKKSKRMRKINE